MPLPPTLLNPATSGPFAWLDPGAPKVARIESWRAVSRCFSGTQARNSPGRLFSASRSSRSGPTSLLPTPPLESSPWSNSTFPGTDSRPLCRFTDPGRAPPQDLTDRSLDHVTDRDPRLIGAEYPCAAFPSPAAPPLAGVTTSLGGDGGQWRPPRRRRPRQFQGIRRYQIPNQGYPMINVRWFVRHFPTFF